MTKTTDMFGMRHSLDGWGANPAFPSQGKPRPEANSGGSTGVQGFSPGTLFLRSAKKHSVLFFSSSSRVLGGVGA